MKVVNERTGARVSENAEMRDSFIGRLRGLILSGKRDIILVAPVESVAAASIHMLGVLFQIDVVWLDSGRRVVDFRSEIRPFNPLNPGTWRIYKPRRPARYVVELSVGRIGGIETGDVLDFD